MPFTDTPIPGLVLFEPNVLRDERGYFFEAFNARTFAAAGITANFVQDNQARSTFGVLRGLHYQIGDYAQAKLVRVLEGEVLDIAVDLRPDSPAYGHYYAVVLSATNQRQLFVPRGFAHGFCTLTPESEVLYKVDNVYNREHEGGLLWSDPDLGIEWPTQEPVLSEKDGRNMTLREFIDKYESIKI